MVLFSNLEYDLLYIPPQKGRLYWQYHDFALTVNSDVKGDSEWVGGIEITACYTDSSEIKDALQGIEPSLAIDECGSTKLNADDLLAEEEKQRIERYQRLLDFINIINPAKEELAARLYVEDFGSDGDVYGTALHNSAPAWAHEKVALIKGHLPNEGEFSTIMAGVKDDVDGSIGRKDKDVSEYPYGTIRVLSKPHRDTKE